MGKLLLGYRELTCISLNCILLEVHSTSCNLKYPLHMSQNHLLFHKSDLVKGAKKLETEIRN